jgi:hypothetical protein
MVCFLYAMSDVRVVGVSEWFFAAVKRIRFANRACATLGCTLTIGSWSALNLRSSPTKAWSEFVSDDINCSALVAFTSGVLALLKSAGNHNTSAFGE